MIHAFCRNCWEYTSNCNCNDKQHTITQDSKEIALIIKEKEEAMELGNPWDAFELDDEENLNKKLNEAGTNDNREFEGGGDQSLCVYI